MGEAVEEGAEEAGAEEEWSSPPSAGVMAKGKEYWKISGSSFNWILIPYTFSLPRLSSTSHVYEPALLGMSSGEKLTLVSRAKCMWVILWCRLTSKSVKDLLLGLRRSTDQDDIDGLVAILGVGSPDDLIGLTGGDLLTLTRLGDDIEPLGLSENGTSKRKKSGSRETHCGGVLN